MGVVSTRSLSSRWGWGLFLFLVDIEVDSHFWLCYVAAVGKSTDEVIFHLAQHHIHSNYFAAIHRTSLPAHELSRHLQFEAMSSHHACSVRERTPQRTRFDRRTVQMLLRAAFSATLPRVNICCRSNLASTLAHLTALTLKATRALLGPLPTETRLNIVFNVGDSQKLMK